MVERSFTSREVFLSTVPARSPEFPQRQQSSLFPLVIFCPCPLFTEALEMSVTGSLFFGSLQVTLHLKRCYLMAPVAVLLPVAYISLPPPIFYRIHPPLGTCLGTR